MVMMMQIRKTIRNVYITNLYKHMRIPIRVSISILYYMLLVSDATEIVIEEDLIK